MVTVGPGSSRVTVTVGPGLETVTVTVGRGCGILTVTVGVGFARDGSVAASRTGTISATITTIPVAAAAASQPLDMDGSRFRSLLRCLRPGRGGCGLVTSLMVALIRGAGPPQAFVPGRWQSPAERNLRRVMLEDPWLAAVWPFVRAQLPAAPAEVAEIGCGSLGGFVPELRSAGYNAIGIDPEAPDGEWYRRAEFERCEIGPVAAIVACTSLHHVADLREAVDRIEASLAPDGVLVVVEWARERFDETTAKWCEDRLPPPGPDPGWLSRHCAEWRQSGLGWEEFLQGWADAAGLYEGRHVLGELSARFDSGPVAYGPFYFADLAGVSEADEQAAIDGGVIQPGRIQYSGRRRG